MKVPFDDISRLLINNNIEILQINFEHLQRSLSLELIHRDPFDRLIVSQAIEQNITIISKDINIKSYPVQCLWD